MTRLLKIQFPTKKFLAKILIKMHRFRLIDQKLNLKVFFRPLMLAHLFKIQIVENIKLIKILFFVKIKQVVFILPL